MVEKQVKRIRDLTSQELRQLPVVKGTLARIENKRTGSVNFTLTAHVAKDFNFIFYLKEEQYALIKLERNIKNDNQGLDLWARISKGSKAENEFYLFEVVPVPGISFHELLSKFRIRSIEIMKERGEWPAHQPIHAYPNASDLLSELPAEDDKNK